MDSPAWGNWLREGNYLSFIYEAGERKFYRVKRRDIAHIEYEWAESISTGTESGPTTISDLEVTIPWTQINQIIFGVRPQCYVYVQLPTDIERHGMPKRSKHVPNYRVVAHFGMHDSPFDNPSFFTEHFMQRPIDPLIALTIYNKTDITITPTLNFWINRMEVEPIGDEFPDGTLQVATRNDRQITKWTDVLDKLSKGIIPCRHVTLLAVRAPATTT